MSAAHTPGVWITKPWFSRDADGAIEDSGFQVVAIHEGTETRIFTSCNEGATEREESDLQLISAAPELLAALIDCVAVMQNELNGLAVIQPELRNALAAIAKATGAAS